jgi:hypothetical protein
MSPSLNDTNKIGSGESMAVAILSMNAKMKPAAKLDWKYHSRK